MALTVADLAEHITTRRRFYALTLEADIELLRRAHGESVVQEAMRLADGAAQLQEPQVLPPARAEHASDIANALDRVMERSADHVASSAAADRQEVRPLASADNALNRVESVVQEAVRLADEAAQPQAQSKWSTFATSPGALPRLPRSAAPRRV